MRKVTVLAVLLCGLGSVSLVAADDNRYVEREEKRFTTAGKPQVSLSTFDGPIEIRTWNRSEVEVIVEKRGADKDAIADITVSGTQTGGRVEVKVDRRQCLHGVGGARWRGDRTRGCFGHCEP